MRRGEYAFVTKGEEICGWGIIVIRRGGLGVSRDYGVAAQGYRSPGVLIYAKHGEPAGTRTQDPRLKRALLYQLSYGLTSTAQSACSQRF